MRTHKLPDVNVKRENMRIKLKTDRIEGNLNKAQYMLDSMVMTHMIPYMPKVTGTFINNTLAMSQAIAGTGEVYAAAPPYGRFLYEGMTMVSPSTGSTWAKVGEKKVLVSEFQGKTNAHERLEYNDSTNAMVTEKWFEAAKKAHGKNWVEMVKKITGKG